MERGIFIDTFLTICNYQVMTHPSGYQEVEAVVRDSEYGRKLSLEARYNKYRHPSVSIEDWQKLLGRDVNNLEHMPLTRGIALALIRHSKTHQPELLDAEDELVIPIAGSMHDVGEAIESDISLSDKTADDDVREALAVDIVTASLYPEGTPPLVEQAKSFIFDHDGETKRGRIFNSIEHLGYMRTAMNAMDLVQSGRSPEIQIPGLQWLYTDVLTNATRRLITDAERIDAVRAALLHHAPRIDQAFKLVETHLEVFDNYDESKRTKKIEDYLLALDAWQQFKDGLSLGLAS
jgi:hypothetical protein